MSICSYVHIDVINGCDPKSNCAQILCNVVHILVLYRWHWYVHFVNLSDPMNSLTIDAVCMYSINHSISYVLDTSIRCMDISRLASMGCISLCIILCYTYMLCVLYMVLLPFIHHYHLKVDYIISCMGNGNRANNYLPSTTVLLYSTVQSVATTTLSFIFLGSSVVPLQIVGSALVIAGLFVTVWSQKKDAERMAHGKDKRGMTTDSNGRSYASTIDGGTDGGHDGISGGGHRTIRSIGGGGYGVDEYDPSIMAAIDSPSGTLTSPVSHTQSYDRHSHHGHSRSGGGSNGRMGSSHNIIVTPATDDDLRQPLVHQIQEE